MSCVWICLNLLCAATYFLQSSASSKGVLVWCPERVEVEAGQLCPINCSVRYDIDKPNCTIIKVQLKRNNGTEDIPKVEHPNYVLLNVPNVTKSNNWTIEVDTDCGLVESNTIKVEVFTPPDLEPGKSQQSELVSKVPAVFGVCVLLTVAIPLLFLFLKHIIRKKFQGDYTPPDSSSPPDEC
ncbi:unnamed protein product [Pleuronectes platessa]|uniref:Uncharacterized protein n=1 Tax=Pleuronectes platessa TaxID=8262 RepID=A0A9N7VFQ2_PLEPL|nr:unnamed protein product [Pleuronectes platessa]